MAPTLEVPGWKLTTTGWNADGDTFRRSFILTREFERYSGNFVGEEDDTAFEAYILAKVKALES